jgi:hypothetical protein
VADIARAADIGDVVMAAEHRRTLDTLCAAGSAYPAAIKALLEEHGLASAPR